MAADPLRLRLRLVRGPLVFGPGKAELLRLIAETGSISAAGRAMGMSYKRAWGLVHEMNLGFAQPLVAAATGGTAGGGATLTEAGRAVVDWYVALESRVTTLFADDLARFDAMMTGLPASD